MDKGSTPTAPDPSKVIPLQGQENRNTFDYQTYQGRTNVNTPYGSSTWSRSPVFDEAGYNAAMDKWKAGSNGTAGTWVPEVPGHNSGGESGSWVQTIPGHWEGGTGPEGGSGGAAPNKADFTNYSWTNDQKYNPVEQGIFDANRDSASKIAGTLSGLTDKYTDSLSKGPDYSHVIGSSGALSTYTLQDLKNMGMLSSELDPSKLAKYGTLGDKYNLGQVRSGDINRGAIDMSYNGVSAPDAKVRDYTQMAGFGPNVRDWAGALGGDVMGTIGQLKGMNPWEFDQQGADASYNQATRYLDVQNKQDQSQIEARLAEQGFVPGTPAYNQAMRTFQDTSNRAHADARDRALLAGREYGNQAFDNYSGNLGTSLSGLLNYGTLGVNNDAARDKSFLDMAGFGLKNDQARGTEAMDIAKFLSGEKQFGANYGLKAQQQDFDQQKDLSSQERTRGLDANQVIMDQYGLDKGRTLFNNDVASKTYNDYADLTKANNDYRGQNFDRGLLTEKNNAAAIAQNNDTRTQQIKEANDLNNLPLQQLLSALGLSKPGTVPGSSTAQTGSINPVDIAGLFNNQYNGQIASSNAQTSSNNATMSAIAAVLAAFVSDRRLKTDIKKVGVSPKGYPWYRFKYLGSNILREGVMAQDVLKKDPSAVITLPSGFYAVDYSKV